jgi:branched-chain amino acid transport system substrate-binding protein
VRLISPNDTSGKDTNTAVVKALKGLGFEVAADEYYERGTKDFYPILTKLLATKPDMLDVAAAPAARAGSSSSRRASSASRAPRAGPPGPTRSRSSASPARKRPRACGARSTST